MRAGDRVRLRTPDNIRLDGATARITELTEWGAHCFCAAAASGCFRATWDEMEPVVSFTGDPCMNCGSLRMRVTGTCKVCEDCGESGGC